MGREIRRVPPNWDHPISKDEYGRERRQPMYDSTYAAARTEWLEELRKWEASEDHDRDKHRREDGSAYDYWEWNSGPPDRAYYRPWSDDEATWFQLWETVSEGTPVSPPFETLDELAQYLAEHGDEWDQKRCTDSESCRLFGLTFGKPGWGKERAEAFCKDGWAPSMMMDGKKIYGSKDIPLQMERDKVKP
mgnify:CR=1 FL=1